MNYYERIQKAINYLEDEIEEDVKVEEAAKAAYMSLSNFYRMFFAITGYSVKEYLRRRRINLAAKLIKEDKMKVIDVATKYSYDSPDSFTRAFKSITGCLPSKYSTSRDVFVFERMDIMEKYFGYEDKELAEKYPDIKVLKEMQPMRVATYRYFGKSPEDGAFRVINEWIHKNNIDLHCGNYRIFGYNSPDPDPGQTEYGYEICITIPNNLEVTDDQIKVKILEGGLFAVTAINREEKKDIGESIMLGWQRFMKWIEGSKYAYGGRQYLEEHLGFDKEDNHIGGVDLYMPITLKENIIMQDEEEEIEPMTVVSFIGKGRNAEGKARKQLFSWIHKVGINLTDEVTRIFAHYNFQEIGKADFVYTIYISIPKDFEMNDTNVDKSTFGGGMYLRRKTKYYDNARSWFDFMERINNSEKYTFGMQPFMEEYLIRTPAINGDVEVVQHMPIVYKKG